MNRNEAAMVLRRIFAATNGTIDTAKADVWFETVLSSTAYETGMAIANDLAVACEFPPTPRAFREALHARTRSEHMREQYRHELPPVPEAATAKAWMERLREGMTLIGTERRPEGTRHAGEDWKSCGECVAVAREVAMEAGREAS